MTKNKITKAQMFTFIKSIMDTLEVEQFGDGAITGEMVDNFLTNELELLAKKSANKKPTKVQEQNEVIKGAILEVLSENGETVTEIMKKVSVEGVELSNQKVSALLRQMIEVGTVVKVVEGKKSLFKRA